MMLVSMKLNLRGTAEPDLTTAIISNQEAWNVIPCQFNAFLRRHHLNYSGQDLEGKVGGHRKDQMNEMNKIMFLRKC